MIVVGVRCLRTAHTRNGHGDRSYRGVLIPRRVGKILYQSFRERNWGRTDLHANSLERHLSPHRERIELRTGIAGVGGADLLGDVAVQIVEHEAHVAVDVPVKRRRIDCLSSTGDAVGGGEMSVVGSMRNSGRSLRVSVCVPAMRLCGGWISHWASPPMCRE